MHKLAVRDGNWKMMIKPAIYFIQDPNTYEIRYIGLSTNYPIRFKEHLIRINHKDRKHLPIYCWLRTLEKNPIFGIIQEFSINISISDLEGAEIYWIKYFKSLGCNLLNCTDGGGLINPSIEVRRKISESKKKLYAINPYANPAKGKPKNNRKPFVDMYGRRWEHSREAAEYYGIDRASIMRVLKGKAKHAGGFVFKYI